MSNFDHLMTGVIPSMHAEKAPQLLIELACYFQDVGLKSYHLYIGHQLERGSQRGSEWKLFLWFRESALPEREYQGEINGKLRSVLANENYRQAWLREGCSPSPKDLGFDAWKDTESKRWEHVTMRKVSNNAYFLPMKDGGIHEVDALASLDEIHDGAVATRMQLWWAEINNLELENPGTDLDVLIKKLTSNNMDISHDPEIPPSYSSLYPERSA